MNALAQRPALRRSDNVIVAGVAAGVAHHFGWSVRAVRVAWACAAVFGIGIAVYTIALVVLPGSDDSTPIASTFKPRGWIDVVALIAVAAGLGTLITQIANSWATLLVVAVAVATLGLAFLLAWPQTNDHQRIILPAWLPRSVRLTVGQLRQRQGLLTRAVVGGVLTVVGAGLLLSGTSSLRQLRDGLLGLSIMMLGVLLIVGPVLGRLGVELIGERRERIRTEERAEMGAHLHDSVLQTLALMQRRANDPREIVRLARKQERELRSWLGSGQIKPDPLRSFATEINGTAAELEELHGVPIDVVTVRDCAVDDPLRAMLLASREAIQNAQRHANAPTVSVFCEVSDTDVAVFVRDRGIGFDRAAVAADRSGVAESIEGRMRRNGGRCEIRTTIGNGTEVELTMSRIEANRD